MDKRVCASVNVYNEIDCLPHCLDSLKDFPLVIVPDGKWLKLIDKNANKEGLSYDGTRELVRSYPNTLLIDCGNKNEEYMSNMALRMAAVKGYDYLLQIASDEYVRGDYFKFQDSCDDFVRRYPENHSYFVKFETIHITPPEQSAFIAVQRLHHDPMFIRLRDIHWVYYFNNKSCKIYQRPTDYKILEGLTIYHDDSPRNAKRESQMLEYQRDNVPRERRLLIKNILEQEEKLDIQDIDMLKIYLPKNEISWFMTSKNEPVYLVRGDLSNEMKDNIRKKFLCKAWQLPEGFAVLPILRPREEQEFRICPECGGKCADFKDGHLVNCEVCGGLGKV